MINYYFAYVIHLSTSRQRLVSSISKKIQRSLKAGRQTLHRLQAINIVSTIGKPLNILGKTGIGVKSKKGC